MNSLTFLINRIVTKVELFSNEKPLQGLLVFLIAIILGIPLIKKIQEYVEKFDYLGAIHHLLYSYQSTFDFSETLILVFVLGLFFTVLLILKKMDDSRKIKDNFSGNLGKWSKPINTKWNTGSAQSSIGKMLVVTNSNHPGLLKGAFSWYDYELTFKAMLPSSKGKAKNIGIFIRAVSSLSGIMLQIRENEFVPHYLFEGSYIIDDSQKTELQTAVPLDVWINFRVIVNGDDVVVIFEGQKLYFKIRGYDFTFVPKDVLYRTETIMKIKAESDKNNRFLDDYLDKYGILTSAKEGGDAQKIARAQNAFDDSQKIFNDATLNSRRLNLEYNQGSVGFRETDTEIAYFRDVILKRTD